MTTKHYMGLESAIQEWLDNACELADWPDVIVGARTVEMMAVAARAVFDACEESQAYAQREGYVKSA